MLKSGLVENQDTISVYCGYRFDVPRATATVLEEARRNGARPTGTPPPQTRREFSASSELDHTLNPLLQHHIIRQQIRGRLALGHS